MLYAMNTQSNIYIYHTLYARYCFSLPLLLFWHIHHSSITWTNQWIADCNLFYAAGSFSLNSIWNYRTKCSSRRRPLLELASSAQQSKQCWNRTNFSALLMLSSLNCSLFGMHGSMAHFSQLKPVQCPLLYTRVFDTQFSNVPKDILNTKCHLFDHLSGREVNFLYCSLTAKVMKNRKEQTPYAQ